MNCEEVQKQLSDLLDKSLDIERAQEIQDHLAACSPCSAEMASLAEYQQLVSNLPTIEPPVGFTAGVMAKVREAVQPPTLWERLFLPLQIKIPLQATAVVLIASLAVYIYQKEPLQRESVVSIQPERSFRKPKEADKLAPSIAQAPRADSKTEVTEQAKLRVQEFKDSVQLKKSQPPPNFSPEVQNKRIAGSQPGATGTVLSQDQVRLPATLSPTPLQEKSPAANDAASPRLEQSSPSVEVQAKGALAPVPPPENASKDAAAAEKPLLPTEARRRSATTSLNAFRSGTVVGVALPADHELAIRLKAPRRDAKTVADRLASGGAETERRSLTSGEEAKNLEQARQQAIQTGQSQTVWVTIARNQYEPFKKELADLGNIEAESATLDHKNDAVAKSSDQIRITVTILPPLPVPSQPSGR